MNLDEDVVQIGPRHRAVRQRHPGRSRGLVRHHEAAEVLARNERQLRRLDSVRGLELWRDAIVRRNALREGAFGCELGSLANELADQDEDARAALARHFRTWKELLAAGLERMRQNGTLRDDADPDELATGIIAALQGGYLLAQTERSTKPMEIALDMALAHVRALAPVGGGPP